MNGINSTLKDEIKKGQDEKRKEKFKLLSTIILSNILVATLCLSGGQVEKKALPPKTLHHNHQVMLLPLSAFLSEDSLREKETIVTLLTKSNKVISSKAYLHELVKKENDFSYFKIEIANQDLKKVSESVNQELVAIPYVATIERPRPPKPRGSKYEIDF